MPTQTPTLTKTATPPPTPTPTPTPTSTPTPIPAARIERGDQALLAGDYDRALQEFQSALAAAPDDATRAAALAGTGRTHLLRGSPDMAITVLTEVVSRFSDFPPAVNARFFLGEAYTAMNNLKRAADSYSAFLKLRGGVVDSLGYERLGDTLSTLGDYKGALAAFETAAKTPHLGESTALDIKAGRMYLALSDYKGAVRKFLAVYDATKSGFYKAQANLLAGQAYLGLGEVEQAYARFQDSVNNYPRYYDSYTALVALVNAGKAVDEFNRGLVDYYAGQYGYAIEAFNRYLARTPNHDGAAHHFKALSLIQFNQPQEAIAEWEALIKDHPRTTYWAAAWDEKAYTQWYVLGLYKEASKTLLDFVERAPDDPTAPFCLFEAARILERKDLLAEATPIWERAMEKYSATEWGFRSLLLAGVTYYRLNNYDKAMTIFQRALVLGASPEEQSAAALWVGKTAAIQNKPEAARAAFEQAIQRDPTGYYSERARQLLLGQAPFSPSQSAIKAIDLAKERKTAEGWVRITFNLPAGTDLTNPGALAADARFVRGTALWELGEYDLARNEFEDLRKSLEKDAAASFRLLNHLLKLGVYRSAILTSRQVLDLAGYDDAGTMLAPAFFNYVRFGMYFGEIVQETAKTESFDPILLSSLIRQESLFEGFAASGAGARGLMQIMPATGNEVAKNLNWPPNFSVQDLDRPYVSIRLGARYLARLRNLFNGEIYPTLAAYNGGPGNAQVWRNLSGADPDLFLEVIRIKETRDYIMQIFTFHALYRRVYESQP